MTRTVALSALAISASLTGCALVPPQENPANVRVSDCENPVLVAPGEPSANSYAKLYETVIDVLDDDFELKPTTRYSGQIETFPRTAPGYEQPWKGGSPDIRERLLATTQSIRHRASVAISSGDRGGFRVYVEVFKELEDLAVPQGVATSSIPSGIAVLQEQPLSVDRRSEIQAASASGDRSWIPAGRDFAFEQKILRKIRDRVNRPDCLK